MEDVNYNIRIENLSLNYGDKTILDQINLELESGKIYTLIGPNGAGKSSFLNALTKDVDFTGNIYIKEENTRKITNRELAKLISKTQSQQITSPLIVKEFIEMGRYPYTNFLGQLKSDDQKIIEKSIALSQIEPLLKKPIHELSDGEKRRVLIAKNLVQNCPIMLFDEPTTFLDIGNKFAFRKLLGAIHSERKPLILFSTHDIELALEVSDIILLVIENKIIEASKEEVLEQKLLEKVFAQYQFKIDKKGNIIYS